MRRVQLVRQLRGLSQEVCAGLCGRSVEWLSLIERNRRGHERIDNLKSLAEVLNVPLLVLLGEQELDRPGRLEESAQATARIQRAIVEYHSSGGAEPPSLATLRVRVGNLWDSYQNARLGMLAAGLPEALTDARLAVENAAPVQKREARRLLASTYHLASGYLKKRGANELALVAADRGMFEALQVEDTSIVGNMYRAVAHALIGRELWSEAMAVTYAGAGYLRPRLRNATPAALSVYGTLHLNAVLASARIHDRAATQELLTQARGVSDRIGSDRNDLWTAFGPTNVAIHELASAVEAEDRQRAIELAPRLDTGGLPVERQARAGIDQARAYAAWGEADAATGTLAQAARIAPEQVHAHPLARNLVWTMLRRQRRNISSQLRYLARRMQLLR